MKILSVARGLYQSIVFDACEPGSEITKIVIIYVTVITPCLKKKNAWVVEILSNIISSSIMTTTVA